MRPPPLNQAFRATGRILARFTAAVLMLAASACHAEFGILETRDHQKLEGDISIAEGTFRVVNTNSLSTNSINITELLRLRIGPQESNSPSASAGGVVLVNGSVLTRKISLADDTAVRFRRSLREHAISIVNVARIVLQPGAHEMLGALQPNRRGLLLRNSDFIDGDFKSLKDGKVRITSVLFGARTFSADAVAAIILRPPVPSSSRFEVRTRDDSLLRISDVTVAQNQLVLRDSVLGAWRVRGSELLNLTRN